MSTAPRTEVLLGCDPQVRVVIIEDAGNLVLQVFAEDPANTDIDALFFNLADGVDASGLTIFPGYDEAIGSNGENVTGYDVATGSLNQMNNGAQIQDSYDVRLEFGTVPYSTAGDVDQAALTFYVDGGASNLTAESIDPSNMTAVINSDSGNGLALTGGTGSTGTDPDSVYVTETVLSADFEGIHYATQSDAVQWNEGWQVTNGEIEANGHNDGNIWFEPVSVEGAAQISFDARAPHTEYFENGGCYGDSLEVWALIDGNTWALLDTFTVNHDGTALVGDTTGQTITATSQTLIYEGGVLENASSVQLVLDADISASNEEIFVDNVEVTDTTIADGVATETVTEENVVASETFDSGSNTSAEHAALVDGHTDWDMRHGELQTDGCDDGAIFFEPVDVNGAATIQIDARVPNPQYFENGGCYGDSLEVWVQVNGTEWVHLDTFTVNHEGTALVGNTTGQVIDADGETLTYQGGALENADTVQVYMYSDISASNEEIYFDNLTISETIETEVPVDGHNDNETCEDFESANAGDVISNQFDGFTVTAQKTGDLRINDAMIFDTDNPTGGDNDLAYSDQGNALIISEDNDGSDPDDNAGGGTFTFEFDDPSTVSSLTLLDIEEAGGTIDLFDVDGALLNSVAIPAAGDNSAQDIEINTDGVATMNVNLVGSGAVDDLCYIAPDANCGQYDVTYDALFNQQLAEDDDMQDDTTDPLMADMMV